MKPPSFSDLIALEDEEFVAGAYQAILGRLPAASETAVLDDLRRGARKSSILTTLSNSEEGWRRGVQIPGLRLHAWVDAARRIPVAALFIDLLNYPGLAQEIVTEHRLARQRDFEVRANAAETRKALAQIQATLAEMQATLASPVPFDDLLRQGNRTMQSGLLETKAFLIQIRAAVSRLEGARNPSDDVAKSVANMAIELASLLDVKHQRLQAQMEALESHGMGTAYALTVAGQLPADSVVIVSGRGDAWLGAALTQLGHRVQCSYNGFPAAADAVFHVGEDLTSMERFRPWLKPGSGKLVMAVEYRGDGPPGGITAAPVIPGWRVLDFRSTSRFAALTASPE